MELPVEVPQIGGEENQHVRGRFIYRVDGNFTANEEIPLDSIIGAWKVGRDGEIISDFIFNPMYRPRGEGSAVSVLRSSTHARRRRRGWRYLRWAREIIGSGETGNGKGNGHVNHKPSSDLSSDHLYDLQCWFD